MLRPLDYLLITMPLINLAFIILHRRSAKGIAVHAMESTAGLGHEISKCLEAQDEINVHFGKTVKRLSRELNVFKEKSMLDAREERKKINDKN